MTNNRDEFPARIREILAKRAGQRCSNPECGAVTSGPHDDPDKSVNVGVAAHITSAAAGGPRYNSGLTPEQRANITNGIWLCQKCAKLIDSDVRTHTEEQLLIWKRRHEETVKQHLVGSVRPGLLSRAPGLLNISAIYQHPSSDNRSCILDIRVSNQGESDLMINAVEFEVMESIAKALLGQANFSAQYDLDISKLAEFRARGECEVAQNLAPGEADRFAIVLSGPSLPPAAVGWRFATSFKTNFGSVTGPEIEVWLPPPKVVRSFASVVECCTERGKAQRRATDNPYTLADRSKFIEAGGGICSRPKGEGYETFIAFDTSLLIYHGPKPLDS
jgi:hypothetical protein